MIKKILFDRMLKRSKYLNLNNAYTDACKEIANMMLIHSEQNPPMNLKQIYKIIKSISAKYRLTTIPKNKDILDLLPNNNHYKNLLKIKPIKTSSGVAVITIMPMPFDCPHGKCIYCPGGIDMNTPLSYIGSEPSTKMAQKVNYDPFLQVRAKLLQLIHRGHDVSKAELVIVGGTFPFYPLEYQIKFITGCYEALNSFSLKETNGLEIELNNDNFEKIDYKSSSTNKNGFSNLNFAKQFILLDNVKKLNESAPIRCVGLTVETKPDYCKQEHVDHMLDFGTTRIELGIQSLKDTVFKLVNRGHSLSDVFEAFYIARNCGYKIAAHMMPGLPGSSYSDDILDSKRLFEDSRLKPDMIKIYPTVVLKHTGLYKLYKNNKYETYSTKDLVNLLVEIKKIIPPWVRIMRIQREIDSADVISGPKVGNLRQMVLKELKRQNIKCKCIRCREIGLTENYQNFTIDDAVLYRTDYLASNGKEIFLSFETKDNSIIFGFLRLRLLTHPLRKELDIKECLKKEEFDLTICDEKPDSFVSAIVRELHIYGPLVRLNNNKKTQNVDLSSNYPIDSLNDNLSIDSIYQHRGLGQRLLLKAEEICKFEYGIKKISVISAIGTKEYYRKFGYTNNGPYVTKML